MKKIHKDDSSFSESQKNRCSHCTLSFSSKIKLSVHIKKKHKKVACMICAMLFVSNVTLRNHMINIHKLPTGINIFNWDIILHPILTLLDKPVLIWKYYSCTYIRWNLKLTQAFLYLTETTYLDTICLGRLFFQLNLLTLYWLLQNKFRT
jgi:hypothetical protein